LVGWDKNVNEKVLPKCVLTNRHKYFEDLFHHEKRLGGCMLRTLQRIKILVKWFPITVSFVIMRNKKKRKNEEGSIWDFLLGLGIGSIGIAFLSSVIKPSCPK